MADDQEVDIPQPRPDTDTISKTGTVSQMAFNLFPDLPTELRLRIWKCALEQPRAVIISPRLLEDRRKAGLAAYPRWRCPVTKRRWEQVSVLFFVNHEARSVALNYNRYSFFSVAMKDQQSWLSLYPLRFAITPNDFVVADAGNMSFATPVYEFIITRTYGFI